jgi:hypothetical protein
MIARVKKLAALALLCGAVCSVVTPAAAQSAPHARHQATLGGAFATAASDTLHVEAIWSEQRRIRVVVQDAIGAPVPLERLRGIEGVAVASGRESPLTLLEADEYFEARLPTLELPAVISVRLKASPAAAEDRLTFSFTDYSPIVLGLGIAAPAEIPGTLAGLLSAVADDQRAVPVLISQSDIAGLFDAENRIRERVLAIEPYLEPLPAEAKLAAQAAITAVVRACWLLHTVMDYGTPPQRDAAVKQLVYAVDRVLAAVSGIPR